MQYSCHVAIVYLAYFVHDAILVPMIIDSNGIIIA